MRNKNKHNDAGFKKVLNRLAEEKKKSVTALCLVAVMVLMWVRLFTKQGPQEAEAGPVTEQPSNENTTSESYRVSFVELPEVAGRNDVLTRDFFSSNGWRTFIDRRQHKQDGIEEVSVISTDGNEELIRKVAKEKLRLGAIMLRANPLVLINNKELSTGGKVQVKDGTYTYEFEIVEIVDDAVVLKCKEAEITLKLTD